MKKIWKWIGLSAVIVALFVPPLYARKIIAGATAEFDRIRRMMEE